MTNKQIKIDKNILIHNRIANKYEKMHGEIYNEIEQFRLFDNLKLAKSFIESDKYSNVALDIGCGAGNLSKHLLELGMSVIASDVSDGFLDLVKYKFSGRSIHVVRINGRDLSNIESNSCDFVAVYSVLHHIPDYLHMIEEMARVCAPGGIVYIDHEPTENFWKEDRVYEDFVKKASKIEWKKYIVFSNYVNRVKRMFNPKYANEGVLIP